MAKRRGQRGGPERDRAQAGGAEPAAAGGARDVSAVDAKDLASDALSRARLALARGDLRAARQLVRGVLGGSPSEPARAEAQRILSDTGPDPAALLAALLVFLTIAVAAWAGLLRHR